MPPPLLPAVPGWPKPSLENQLVSFNVRLVELTRETARKRAQVAGCLSPTGLVNEPVQALDFHELIDIYAEQAFALQKGGADLLVVETMLSLTEARAALLGARQTGMPVYVTFTVDEKGKTLSRGDPLSALIVLQRLGAAGFGVNCCAGFAPLEELFRRLVPYARIPLIAKPARVCPAICSLLRTFPMRWHVCSLPEFPSPAAAAEPRRPTLPALRRLHGQLFGGCPFPPGTPGGGRLSRASA